MKSTFHLELPPICNQECVFCVISAKKNGISRTIDVERQLKRVFENTAAGDRVFIGGGEPTYWTNLEDLYRGVVDSGRSAYVITNGSRPEVLEKLFSLGMKKAVVSFFSSEEKIHNLVTRSDHFPLLERSLAVCSLPGRSLHVNYVVTRFNQDKVASDVSYLVSKYRPVSVTFQPIILFGRATLSQSISVPNLSSAAVSVNSAVKILRDAGVSELKVAFFPHCLLEDPSIAEDAEASSDEERKNLVGIVSKRSSECASCSRAGRCR